MKIKYFLHDATPTWAGYNHQGSCGLLVAVNKIIKILIDDDKNISKVKRFSIEFEGMEDFSILKDNKYIEIHQVKNNKHSGFSKYKESIWMLLAKTEMLNTVESSFLHLTHKLNKVSAADNSSLFNKFQGYAVPKNISDDQRSNSYWTPRECYEYFDELTKDDPKSYNSISDVYRESFQKFNIYKYRDKNYYITDTEISEEVKKSIKFFLEIIEEEPITPKRVENVYNYLKAYLDENIAKRNEVLKNRDVESQYFSKKISFIDIYKILKTNLETLSIEAIVFKEKEKLNAAVEDFYLDIEGEPDSKEIYEKQKEIINKINNLNVNELVTQFIYMNPNIQINKTDTNSFDLPNRENLKNTIIEMFAQIEKEINYENFVYIDEENTYKPTTITSKRHKSVVKAIVKNTNKEMFSTYKYYITEALTHEIDTDPDVTKYETEEENNKNNVTKRNWPKLIKLEEAKEELN